ncbi:MAG: sulfatase-like hydrolase/transferase [Planctomycetes bacterium]|nr:sulfatase-like hydrolase/transferase [Planctomycetota bacterium]
MVRPKTVGSTVGIGRRDFLRALGLGTAQLVGGRALARRRAGKPNILFLFSDQQRWDTVGCYGVPIFAGLTPNLDKLAAQGIRFENSFTCQPVCGPARAVLQTGKWATQLGCFRNGIALPLDEKTIAGYLREAGYEVGYLGKWHLAATHGMPSGNVNYQQQSVPPERRGGYQDFWLASDVLEFTSHGYDGHMFDAQGNQREFPAGRYRVDAQTDWAIEYLKGRRSDKPFFLFVSYLEPHHQNDHRHFEGPTGSKDKYAKYRVPGDLEGTAGDWRQEMPDYLGCCASLDQNVGRLLGTLEELGIADETLVFYTCDHACHFRTRNGEYKRACHDNAIRTPLIVRGPGFTGGKVVRELVSLIDLPPTILAAGGVPTPVDMAGRALQPLVTGTVGNWPEEVFVQISESQVGRAIRTKKWKYSVRARGKNGGRVPAGDTYTEDFLYDLQNDPHERNNLVSDPQLAAIRTQLAQLLKRRMVQAGEAEPKILPWQAEGAG